MATETCELIDIGVNLTHRRFDRDRHDVIARALRSGVQQMIVTGVDAPGSEAAVALASEYPGCLHATAGVHPHHASHWSPAVADTIEQLAAKPAAVAIGETGLDFNRDFSPHADQEHALREQLEIAARQRLPVFLHQRDAHERFLSILDEYHSQLTAAVVHCFTGDRRELRDYLDRDLHIGVTGWICDERRGGGVRECIVDVPAHRLMVETDAPFLLPRDIRPKPRGGRNEPALLPHIVATVARLRGTSRERAAAETTATARAFFGLHEGRSPTGR